MRRGVGANARKRARRRESRAAPFARVRVPDLSSASLRIGDRVGRSVVHIQGCVVVFALRGVFKGEVARRPYGCGEGTVERIDGVGLASAGMGRSGRDGTGIVSVNWWSVAPSHGLCETVGVFALDAWLSAESVWAIIIRNGRL